MGNMHRMYLTYYIRWVEDNDLKKTPKNPSQLCSPATKTIIRYVTFLGRIIYPSLSYPRSPALYNNKPTCRIDFIFSTKFNLFFFTYLHLFQWSLYKFTFIFWYLSFDITFHNDFILSPFSPFY